jgi:hypothetical protein
MANFFPSALSFPSMIFGILAPLSIWLIPHFLAAGCLKTVTAQTLWLTVKNE